MPLPPVPASQVVAVSAPEPWRLLVITRTANIIREMETTLERMVGGARRDGYTWDQIGRALNMTRGGAQKQFRDALTKLDDTDLQEL